MSTQDYSTRSPSRRGFTLIELMVVISIIMLLATIFTPTIRAAFRAAMIAKCRANVGKIAQACVQYAEDDRYHRGWGVAKSLPTVDVTSANWANMEDGNPACLWLLVRHSFAARETFLCPEAGTRLRNYAAAEDDDAFIYEENRGSSLSYSYTSMVGPLRDETTIIDDIGTSLVILADKNPRAEFNSSELSDPGLGDYTEDTLNHRPADRSSEHRSSGQNIARLDGSAEWFVDSGKDSNNGNDIYAANDSGDDSSGERSAIDDAFCIP
ncbi:MAG: type II secretion system protein [Planctomycetota bacterium]|jgi:prepilin-type N-terminal cleavage/methylation domain-containing protein